MSSTTKLHNRQLAKINSLKHEARQAADTIERLQKERDHFENAYKQTVAKNLEVIEARDAALAEVEQIRSQIDNRATSVAS